MTKLYLRINVPGGRRVRLVNKRTTQVIPKTDIILFPDVGTEVTEERAKEYLAQDPYLVATEKYTEKNDPSLARS